MERQKAAILARSHGNPSDAPDATIVLRRNGEEGFNITFSLGMSEKDYVRKLDDMLVQLNSPRRPDDGTTAVRNEFRALDGAGMPEKNARCLARFIVNLDLSVQSDETDRGRLRFLAPQMARWREFKLDGAGKRQMAEFMADEANALIRDYEKPAKKAGQYTNDIATSMVMDINRGVYTIDGKRFAMRPAAEVLEAFDKVVTTPAAKRALSILMSQASALPVLSVQMQYPVPPNDYRRQPIDPTTLAGSDEFVSRGITGPDLFMSQQIVDDVTSIFDLSVSGDGTTATLKIVKSAKLTLGTDPDKIQTPFGSVVVEEEVTVNLAAEIPTVTNVRLSQRFDDSTDLPDRYLSETLPIPAPPEVPPASVPAPGPVPDVQAGAN